jgi:hypothetical protein
MAERKGAASGTEKRAPTLDEVKALVGSLSREHRASLRTWLLAAYDGRGNQRGAASHDRDEPRVRG